MFVGLLFEFVCLLVLQPRFKHNKGRSRFFSAASLITTVGNDALSHSLLMGHSTFITRFVYHLKRGRLPRKLVKYIFVCKFDCLFCPKHQKTTPTHKYIYNKQTQMIFTYFQLHFILQFYSDFLSSGFSSRLTSVEVAVKDHLIKNRVE